LAILARLRRRRLPTVITLHDYWWVCANGLLLTNYDATVCAGPRGYLNCTRCAVARGGARLWPAAPVLWASLRRRADLLRRGAAAADLLLTPSAFVAEWHAAQGFPTARVRPLGVDLAVGPRTRAPARPLRLAMIGGLSLQKGVHVVVDAVSRHADDMTLTVAGTGEDRAFVADLRRRAGPNVTWAGRLDRAGVAALLAASDAVLVPSLSYETFSLTLHEAWAAGVPVIASDLGVMARAVRHGVDGLLVPPGDVDAWAATLARLAAAPQELARLAQGIQPPPTVARHLELLQQDYADVWAARAGRVA
jgi:glycosyltransferase involved in cell wall biosynthesis